MHAWKKTEPFKQMKFPKSKNNKSQELFNCNGQPYFIICCKLSFQFIFESKSSGNNRQEEKLFKESIVFENIRPYKKSRKTFLWVERREEKRVLREEMKLVIIHFLFGNLFVILLMRWGVVDREENNFTTSSSSSFKVVESGLYDCLHTHV